MRSWVFFNRLFYMTFGISLGISIVAKLLINLALTPLPPEARLSLMEGRIFPFPPGRFAITHYEHWHDSWPDYSDDIVGQVALRLGSLIESFATYDNVELLVYVGIFVAFVLFLSLWTIGKPGGATASLHVGMGLYIGSVISNQAEVALFGHATDFLFISPSESSPFQVYANFADFMAFAGILLIAFTPVYQRASQAIRSGRSGPD